MSSREQHHRPHLFSLSLSLPSPDLRRIPHPPFLFSSHVLSPPLERRDRTVQHIIRTLNYPYPLSLSLSREYGEIVAQIGSLCYVRGARVTISRISIRNTF